MIIWVQLPIDLKPMEKIIHNSFVGRMGNIVAAMEGISVVCLLCGGSSQDWLQLVQNWQASILSYCNKISILQITTIHHSAIHNYFIAFLWKSALPSSILHMQEVVSWICFAFKMCFKQMHIDFFDWTVPQNVQNQLELTIVIESADNDTDDHD